MTKGLVASDFGSLTTETARTMGQKLYLQYGITGVRATGSIGFAALRGGSVAGDHQVIFAVEG